MDDKNRPELTDLTLAEIADNLELFQRNEYLRLTGQWFTPLPCHFWDLKEGMEIEIQVEIDGGKTNLQFCDMHTLRMISGYINDYSRQYFITNDIKKIRIISFEVKDETKKTFCPGCFDIPFGTPYLCDNCGRR